MTVNYKLVPTEKAKQKRLDVDITTPTNFISIVGTLDDENPSICRFQGDAFDKSGLSDTEIRKLKKYITKKSLDEGGTLLLFDKK